jgi:60S ribosomal subunit assembly/export protein LOC1
MAPTRTKTSKGKQPAGNISKKGGKNTRKSTDGVTKTKRPKAKAPATQIKGRTSVSDLRKKPKKRVYTDKELEIPTLNRITPVGVQKPRGKKKGKVFVDDRVCV